jgi:uncharacterized hydrophobic protein (TIGR00271 family)
MAGLFHLDLDADRFKAVYEVIAEGSEPKARFYLMVAVSTLIASFGLVSNSTAVVIGAMLVAPLMTPIFGISLGLVRGDTRLFQKALRAEVLGVVSAVAMGLLMGWLLFLMNPFPDATPEMVARTSPNLLDLFVAILSGFAGAYALLDEKISPALPGVAIATAIVPPLANCGLHLALGAYGAALGSFLLFVANFLSILLVASVLFFQSGMGREHGAVKKVDIARRFGLAALCFVIMAGFLGNALHEMLRERRLLNSAKQTLIAALTDYTTTGIDELIVHEKDEKLFVMARIHSPGQIYPDQVSALEKKLAEQLGMPTELVFRLIKTNDIMSSGSAQRVLAHNLDGFYLTSEVSPKIKKIRTAEQVIREFLNDQLGMDLLHVGYIELGRGPTIMAMILGVRRLTPDEVINLETKIKKAAQDDNLGLLVRFMDMELLYQDRILRLGWSTTNEPAAEQVRVEQRLQKAVAESFREGGAFLVENCNINMTDSDYTLLAEVSGAAIYTKADLIRLQEKLNTLADKPVTLYIRLNRGAVMTDGGLVSYDQLTEAQLNKYGPALQAHIRELLRSTR